MTSAVINKKVPPLGTVVTVDDTLIFYVFPAMPSEEFSVCGIKPYYLFLAAQQQLHCYGITCHIRFDQLCSAHLYGCAKQLFLTFAVFTDIV
jgi:hypothetical protein